VSSIARRAAARAMPSRETRLDKRLRGAEVRAAVAPAPHVVHRRLTATRTSRLTGASSDPSGTRTGVRSVREVERAARAPGAADGSDVGERDRDHVAPRRHAPLRVAVDRPVASPSGGTVGALQHGRAVDQEARHGRASCRSCSTRSGGCSRSRASPWRSGARHGGSARSAAWSWHASEPTGAIVRISFRHVSGFAGAVERRSAEELARLPAHMRPLDAGRPATARRSEARLTVTAADRAVCVSARDAGWAGDGYDVGSGDGYDVGSYVTCG
jgi:hypothetical protein